jgi:hypothetical protein
VIGAASLFVLAVLCIQVLLIWAAAFAVAGVMLILLVVGSMWKRWGK